MTSTNSKTKLDVAVVGHTNAGKTSLLRTLLRDSAFGEVSDSPGTTRDVTGARINLDGYGSIELFDTPGLEDSIGLLEEIERSRTDHRADGPECIDRFLNSNAARTRFEQEAKAIRQLLACHVALYVIDARDRVLARYRDELRILSYCARPIIPVLNFVADRAARTSEWREQLARLNLHAVAEFDTVILEEEGEIHLYEKVASLLDPFRGTLEHLIRHRRNEREQLIVASAQLIAELLVDVASFAMVVDKNDESSLDHARENLQQCIREREKQCVDDLLELHRFNETERLASPLPVEHGQWQRDLFSQHALQEYGVRGGGGAAAGAMVGLTIDVMFGGISLGAATAIGAAIGAALAAGQRPGMRLLERIQGRIRLRADDTTWRLLAARQIDLTHALLHRGHAGRTPVTIRETHDAAFADDLDVIARTLKTAASHPEWSNLSKKQPPTITAGTKRTRIIDDIASTLAKRIRNADQS